MLYDEYTTFRLVAFIIYRLISQFTEKFRVQFRSFVANIFPEFILLFTLEIHLGKQSKK